ncbi:phage major capsid protein [Enterococcus faecalis]|uniref:phage major capsid protein n=1 Tax=Enterococcus TaxID=1350 RepID=UPI0001F0AD67|nr:phage major capsid protein [Enterococcus faecalis]EFU18080.1 phage major capsid protein, HK97 family [Enterococcus faecalis TX1346]EGO2633272.1 phage major capsid protein [Enterococcus faecalis]EHZ5379349.1 phage major capsid protein [Enterococcus faecalis]EKK0953879.1 phage major capsid protein [Enterococcus faecalis]MCD5106106.1 phage major capsid protein [Enterococcus faecalis]
MDTELLKKMKARREQRLTELREKVESGELREADLEAITKEIDAVVDELNGIKSELSEADGSDEGSDADEGTGGSDGSTGSDENRSGEGDEGDEGDDGDNDDSENRSGMITQQQRDGLLGSIKNGLEARAKMTNKQKDQQLRKAFANFVVGNISEAEARALGIEAGNGSVTVPEVIASEVITYAQEENLLRKYGTVVRTSGDVKYPILVKKADANVNKKERSTDIAETAIQFDEILLDPAEFDALATVTKKLLKMSGVPVEDIVVEELKKAYVRKEINYMFNGDDAGNENPGALAKKAVAFEKPLDLTAAGAGQKLYDALIEFKNTPVTEVMKKGRFIINRAALTAIEKMKTDDGFPLLRPFTQAEGGIGYQLVGYPVDWTDAADKKGKPDTPVLYFGDFSAFKIQEVIGALEIQKLVEKFSGKNQIGFQIYNLLDGQLVYSPFEPAVYRYEITKPAGGGE